MPFNNASEGNYDDDNGDFEENVPDTYFQPPGGPDSRPRSKK